MSFANRGSPVESHAVVPVQTFHCFSKKQNLGSLYTFTIRYMDKQVDHSMSSPEINPVLITLIILEAKGTAINTNEVRDWALLATSPGRPGKSRPECSLLAACALWRWAQPVGIFLVAWREVGSPSGRKRLAALEIGQSNPALSRCS